ncbi:BTB/POZ domain-containing protein 2-like [Lycorma delicatula]|uniref:BTB/POZ domain-containing protein 2-like n=1 Tax=Lycorma delicatula TaxID=130591 RepID=UPI003F512C40
MSAKYVYNTINDISNLVGDEEEGPVPQNRLPNNVPSNQCALNCSSGTGFSQNQLNRGSPVLDTAAQTASSSSSSSPPSVNASTAVRQQPDNAGNNVHNSSQIAVYNWQATKTTVKERFAFMFNNEILCDVHFVVGRDLTQQRIPAHKFVLSVGSAVFDAMFNGTLATQADEIELPDVEPAAFLALLKFLYSDEVQIGPETVMTTLYTAKKYAVPALERHCVEFLKSNLGPDNAFMLLTQARLFDEPQLAALCLDTIDKNTSEALSADGFTDVDLETLSAVLERDTLRIREAKLFQAVVRWSEAECNRQEKSLTPENKRIILGSTLNLIRFPLMSVEEFASGPAQSGILTDQEVVSLFLYFHVNPKPALSFCDTPRCTMTGKEQSVNRFQSIETRWGYSGTSDRIRFTADRRIFVVGFGLYGSVHGPTEYEVNVQIIRTSTGKVCGSNTTSFSCDGSNDTFRVMFKEPIEILPNTSYMASATLKGPDSHYGTKGQRKVVTDCPGGKVTFQFSYAAGNNNGTSVEDGQIPEILFYT